VARTLSLCIAGATGWTGRALVPAVLDAPDLRLVSAVSRSAAGGDLGEALGGDALGVPVHATVAGACVVIGSSGLTAGDFDEVDKAAKQHSVGVVASGNFSLTAAMWQAGALLAARHLPQWEVIDYAGASKPDVPSGTARELAERLAEVRRREPSYPIEQLEGPKEARGATVAGTQVHSVRLASFVVSTEVVFAGPDERLTIRHDAGATPQPYVEGTLLAVRKVKDLVGLTRGLDTLLAAE
jgi:4-hydroxy-tetrahydrodipicolinate reductase